MTQAKTYKPFTFSNPEFPTVVMRRVAGEWYDGRDSVMYLVGVEHGMPTTLAQFSALARECDAALAEIPARADVAALADLRGWAARQTTRYQSMENLRRALLKALEAGCSGLDVVFYTQGAVADFERKKAVTP